MLSLANQLVRRPDGTEALEDQLVSDKITVKSLEASYENAKLTREIDEIALLEYEQGIYLQDEATLSGELALANTDLSRTQDRVQFGKDQLARSRQASKNLGPDSTRESKLADIVAGEEIQLRRAELALAQAESKLKILREFTKPKRARELRSLAEKARAAELRLRADVELGQSKLKRLKAAIEARRSVAGERRDRDARDRQTRTSIGRAMVIEEKLQAKLRQFTSNGKHDDSLRQEIQDLSNQLEAVIDQAEVERSAAQFDALKAKIHSAAETDKPGHNQ